MDEVTWSYIVLVLASLPWILYFIAGSLFVISIVYGRFCLYRPTPLPLTSEDDLPGVSIIKPLMGVDPYLETNLESHFTLDYPKFEVLLCVQDDQDPVIELARTLMSRYPKVDATLYIGGKEGIQNPMVHNMCPGYEGSKYPVVWISTSRIKGAFNLRYMASCSTNLIDVKQRFSLLLRIFQLQFEFHNGIVSEIDSKDKKLSINRDEYTSKALSMHDFKNCLSSVYTMFTGQWWTILVSTEILADMVGRLQNPKVALVHQIPFTTDQPGIAAAMEKVYFGSNLSRYYMAFHSLGVSCFTGMSYLIRKSALDELQGLAWFGQFLAEDYFIAKLLQEKWLRLRMNLVPLTAGVLEPLGESLILGVYAAWSASYLMGVSPYVWFSVHCVVWCLLDYCQLRGMQNGPLPFSFPTFVFSWLLRELLFVFVYFEAILNVRKVRWGKNAYRMSNCGAAMELAVEKENILPI